ncbi:MAG: class I adenylate-forming enzyme family protein [Mycobacteriales bacterium]
MTSAPRAGWAVGSDAELAHRWRGRRFADRLPIPPTLAARLEEQAARRGGDPYLTAVAPDGSAGTVTYAEVGQLTGRLAGWLRADLELRPGEPVGLLPVNDLPSALAVLALLRSGCPALLLPPDGPPDRHRRQLRAAGARLALRSPAVPAGALPEALPLPAPAALPDRPTPPAADLDPASAALCFGTSGSTAESKLVVQSHYNAVVNAEAVRRHHRLSAGDRFLGCLPVHHVNGLHFTLLGTLWSGAHAVLAGGFDPFGYPGLVERFRPRVASVVPSILEALVETWRRPPPAGLDHLVSAAAPLPARTARAVLDRLGVRVVQGYGLTETVNFATTLPVDLPEPEYRRLVLDAEVPAVGTAVTGNEVAVLVDGQPAPPGTRGEVCVRGHNVMTGYLGNPEATAEAFAGGWFHTRDLGHEVVGADGRRHLVLTGRTKNVAKVQGESVSLEEIDRVLLSVPGIRDAASVAVPDRFLGERIVTGIVTGAGPDGPAGLDGPARADGADGLDERVRAALGAALPARLGPRRIVRLERIPRTPTGKVLRPQLAETLRDRDDGDPAPPGAR